MQKMSVLCHDARRHNEMDGVASRTTAAAGFRNKPPWRFPQVRIGTLTAICAFAALCGSAHASPSWQLESREPAAAPEAQSLGAPARPESKPTYTPRYHTIANDILAIEKDAAGGVTSEMLQLLDTLLDEAKAEITVKPASADRELREQEAAATLKKIDDILIRHNFIYPLDTPVCWTVSLWNALKPENLGKPVLDRVLAGSKNRRRKDERQKDHICCDKPFHLADCDTASFLYLAVADVLDLPLSLVEVPGHNFVQWSFGGIELLRWETMYGCVKGLDYYNDSFQWNGSRQDLVDRGVYLRPMTRQEVMGYAHTNAGLMWQRGVDYGKDAGCGCTLGYGRPPDFGRAVEAYRRSIQLYRTSPFAYNNAAWLLATTEDDKLRNGPEAVKLALRAVDIWPTASHLDTLAAAYAEAGDFGQAELTERKAYDRVDDSTWNAEYEKLWLAYKAGKTYLHYKHETAKPGSQPPVP
jgi:hypothetical protein